MSGANEFNYVTSGSLWCMCMTGSPNGLDGNSGFKTYCLISPCTGGGSVSGSSSSGSECTEEVLESIIPYHLYWYSFSSSAPAAMILTI